MTGAPTIHANCVVVGEAGVLIRGMSGAGKSGLSERLVDEARARGLFARLVADDRVRIEARGGRLVARVPERIAGLIERRGQGIAETPHLGAAVLRLVVDLEDAPERMPEAEEQLVLIEGVRLARLSVAQAAPDAPALVLRRLAMTIGGGQCGAFALALQGRTGGMKGPRASARP